MVGDALGQIAEGRYGVCLQCEEEVSQKRLTAVPWALSAFACQEQPDCSRQPEVEYREGFLRDAA